ncbi:hypothetical protein CsatB_025454 [Cannabis sativa]|uniref:S-protein homolog n=1 Tax=Cannabis sativa TaxID=3483 RepID=A0A7J6EA81_CANSA|nr:hypothetical protein F8388_026607 [Cannabis sativa]KAF4367294.1 hypothetical protein G4B88_026801 [Cannabis sativa]
MGIIIDPLLLFVIIIFFSSSLSHKSLLCEANGGPAVDIVVRNGLNTDLTVHCKSKDDDIGIRLLHNNDSFLFSFLPNFWGTTLFFCSFQWDKEFHRFDIFKSSMEVIFDINLWIVHPNGPCLHDGYAPQKKSYCYPWKP